MILRDQQAKSFLKGSIKNFKAHELACKCCDKLLIDDFAITCLDELRHYSCDFKIFLTSAYRCPINNEKVGGKPSSLHLVGQAFDIDVSKLNSFQLQTIIRYCFNHSFMGLGVGDGRLHIDTRKTPTAWLY